MSSLLLRLGVEGRCFRPTNLPYAANDYSAGETIGPPLTVIRYVAQQSLDLNSEAAHMRTLAVFFTLAAVLTAAEYEYRHPFVFGRGHQDEKTGRFILRSKISIMKTTAPGY